MLETLISSRIRRALFEHILSHPTDRFYLRGLAKELQLSISPLRRELKRLERSGLLRADQEGNMLFYTVDTACPLFLQLKHASLPAEAFLPATRSSGQAGAQAGETTEAPSESRLGAMGSGLPPSALSPQPILVGTLASQQRSLWSSLLSHPVLLGAAGVGMVLTVITVSLVYFSMTNHRLVSQASRAVITRHAEITMVVPPASSSGTMRGSRWQIVPGGFGGFSSSSTSESY